MATSRPVAGLIDDEWLPLLRDALARGERFRWPLSGNSMRPTVPPGWQIEIVPLPVRTRVGAIIVFSERGDLVAHRLVRRAGAQWITQGDGRLGPDRPLEPSKVLGEVIAAYDQSGRRRWPGRFPRTEPFPWLARFHLLRAPRYLRSRARRLLQRSMA